MNNVMLYFALVAFGWFCFIAWLLTDLVEAHKLTSKKMDFLNEAQRHTALAVLELLEALRLERTAQVKHGSPFDSEQPFGAEGPVVKSIEVEPGSDLDKLMQQVFSVVQKRQGEQQEPWSEMQALDNAYLERRRQRGDVFCIGCKGANFPNANTCGICAQARGVKGPVVN